MIKVPESLSGASLLGVHNWVKQQVARSNPGGSPDYSITDASGNKMTLSDVSRSAGRNINIEMADAVRSNPASGFALIPEMEMKYGDVPRIGNNLTELLPNEVDSAMATRIIAEQGLRRGLHTLNRLALSPADVRIRSPTTAALLQMGEAIRSNPSDRTPFTQRTPINYSSEKGLAEFLRSHIKGVEGVEEMDEVAYGAVADAKVAARYGLHTQDIEKFARDSLSDFLFAASANRGLLRTLVRNMPELKGDRNTVAKLMTMFPQQPRDFYEGSQKVFVASPAFIYPMYAESILSDRDMQRIVSFAKEYPANVRLTDSGEFRIPRGMNKLVGSSDRGIMAMFRAFITGRKGTTDSSDALDEDYSREGYLTTLVKALAADPKEMVGSRDFKPLMYYSDLGGMYPTPPPKWPKALVYSVMDAFLMNLPYIINMDDPTSSNLTPVQMAYMSDPAATITIEGKEMTLAQAREKMESLKDKPEELSKYSEALDEARTSITGTSELTFDPSKGKSILEFAYDVAELATEKYNYNMRGDDFKFVMALIYYSFEAMKVRTPGTAFELVSGGYDRIIESFMGAGRKAELDRLTERIRDSSLDDEVRTRMAHGVVLARIRVACDQIVTEMGDTPDSAAVSNARVQLQQLRDATAALSLHRSSQLVAEDMFANTLDQIVGVTA